ncbi:MAG TPA: hypothetical protein VFB58_00390 [Chloroflexota bacterium]|nr:hypothetical protein [Chloroflexota bacterium]
MNVAGIRLGDGRLVWVAAEGMDPQPLDEAVVRIGDQSLTGVVVVAPAQLSGSPDVAGHLVSAQAREVPPLSCDDLPGAAMPPLGTETPEGIVTAINAVTGMVSLTRPDGERVEFPSSRLE